MMKGHGYHGPFEDERQEHIMEAGGDDASTSAI